MSRRLNNLLASLVAAAVGTLGIQCTLRGAADDASPRGPDSESPPRVQVKFAGIAPRAPVRLDVQRGHEEVVRFTLWRKTRSVGASGDDGVPTDLANDEVGGADLSQAAAALGAEDAEREASFTLALQVEAADAETVTVSWEVDEARALGPADAAWAAAVKQARGWEGETTLSRSGLPLDATMNRGVPGDPLAAELHTSLRRWMAAPAPVFPPGAIGHGAIWEVQRDLTTAGVLSTETSRLELTRVGGGDLGWTERVTGALRGGQIALGKELTVLDSIARSLSLGGDAAWSRGAGRIVALGEGGATSELEVVFELGISSLVVTSTAQTELVVDAP